MHEQIHGGIDKNIIVYHERLREAMEKSLTELLPISEEKACGIPYFLTFKERDPMKKTIAEVKGAIAAEKFLLEESDKQSKWHGVKCGKFHYETDAHQKKISQLEDCLKTLETLQEDKK